MSELSNNDLKSNGLSNAELGRGEILEKIRTASSVNMSGELFEKLYLSPPNQVKGSLRKTFANPTPIGVASFLLSLTPLSCDLMGWRGAGGFGAAEIGVYFFIGGLGMFISGLLEWVLGNSFPATVFVTFGCFWLALGGTLTPSFGSYAFYAPPDSPPFEGLASQGFNASLGFWFLAMALLCVVYLICSTRTNVVFVFIFFTLIPAFGLLTAAFWLQAEDIVATASTVKKLLEAAGAFTFVTCVAGWYLLLAMLLATVDAPFSLPVGDLSGMPSA